MSLPVFLYGSLLEAPVRRIVLAARAPSLRLRSARMPGFQARAADCLDEPFAVPVPGSKLPGVMLGAVSDSQRARLDFFHRVQGLEPETGTVESDGEARACIWFTRPDAPGGQGWTHDAWPAWCRSVTEQAAVEIMRYFGQVPAGVVCARLGMIRARAASRVRGAGSEAPTDLRADWNGATAIREFAHDQPWSGFFTVETSTLSFRRFAGDMSQQVSRAGFVGGDAALVLPYDPAHDLVLVIEQFRFGPYLRHDRHPWLLEPVAGRVDGGETPEQCARREAAEEAGLVLSRLERVADYYPSPGVDSEFFYTFVGLADLAGYQEGIGGLAAEHEDIRSHVIGFARLMKLLSSGEANCGPLVLLALWLAQNRSRLRRYA